MGLQLLTKKMGDTTKLLEDTFTFETVPFKVEVKQKDLFVNARTGETSEIVNGRPDGFDRTPRNWVQCEVVVATLRPDYRYTVEKEWPENVDKHFGKIVPLENPVKNGWWRLCTYSTMRVRDIEDVNPTAVAEKLIQEMKQAYENRTKVETLN